MNAVSAPLPLHFVHWDLTLGVMVLLSTLFPTENILHERGLRRLEGKQASHVLKSETWKTGEGPFPMVTEETGSWKRKLTIWATERVSDLLWCLQTGQRAPGLQFSWGSAQTEGAFWRCSCFKSEVLCSGLLNEKNVWGLSHSSIVFQYAPRMEKDTCLKKTSLNYKENLWNLMYILIQTLEC